MLKNWNRIIRRLGSVSVDTIYEHTSGSGVTIDGVLLKDSKLLGTITIPSATDTMCLIAASQVLTNKTLDASVAKGTWTASGTWTIPAVTLAGTVTGGNQNLNNLGHIGLGNQTANALYGSYYSESITIGDDNDRAGVVGILSAAKTSAAYTSHIYSLYGQVTLLAANTQDWEDTVGLMGVFGLVTVEGGADGVIAGAANFTAYTIIAAMGSSSPGIITKLAGLWVRAPSISSAADVGTFYGIYLEAAAGATANYAIYSAGGNVYLNDILFIGDSNVANTKMTGPGITIDQGGIDTEAFAVKSSDIDHGMTDYAEIDTYFTLQKASSTDGGVKITGLTEVYQAIIFEAFSATAMSTAKTTSAYGYVEFRLAQQSGTGVTNPAADENLVVIKSGVATAAFIFDADGDFHCTDVVCGLGEGGSVAVTGGEVRAPHLAGGTNQNGADLVFTPGFGTGTGDAAILTLNGIVIKTSGVTVHTATPMVVIDENKMGFFGATPVDKPDTVADATGCTGDADDKVNLIIDRLQELGLLA